MPQAQIVRTAVLLAAAQVAAALAVPRARGSVLPAAAAVATVAALVAAAVPAAEA